MPPDTLRDHHRRAIDKLAAKFRDDTSVLALVIGGSVAKGWAREDSDVDFLLIVTDEEAARREPRHELMIISNDYTDYDGGYVDGKALTLGFLREVAAKGSEPAKSAFLGTWTEFDRSPDNEVSRLIEELPTYPEEGHEDRMRAFYAQMNLWRWFVGEAEKRGDRYLLLQAATNIALFSMRIILAANHRIYPYHKWVSRAVHEVSSKPEGFEQMRDDFLAEPTSQKAARLIDAVNAWLPLEIGWPEMVQRFVQDREWNWREHRAPIEDW